MTKYEIFEKLIKAYKDGNDAGFQFFTFALLEQETENPYRLEYEEHSLFSSVPILYKQYKRNAVGSKKAAADIVNAMKRIMAASTMNPYGDFFNQAKPADNEPDNSVDFGVDPSKVKIVDEPEAIMGQTVSEPKIRHVFGVIPKYEPTISDEPEPRRRKKKASK